MRRKRMDEVYWKKNMERKASTKTDENFLSLNGNIHDLYTKLQ